eukprot:scpid92486/ scgid30369/ 
MQSTWEGDSVGQMMDVARGQQTPLARRHFVSLTVVVVCLVGAVLLGAVCQGDAQLLSRQTNGRWSCRHVHNNKEILSGSYPNLDYAPIVSPQNADVCGDRYTPNVDCKYEVFGPDKTFIYVEFLSLDLDSDCSKDSLSVIGKRKSRKLCGSKNSRTLDTFVIDDNVASVTFQSNLEYACRGFSGFMVVFTPGESFFSRRRKRKVRSQPELRSEAVKVIGDGKLHAMRHQTEKVYTKGTCDICTMTQVSQCKCAAPFFDNFQNKKKQKDESMTLLLGSSDTVKHNYILYSKLSRTRASHPSQSRTRSSRRTSRPSSGTRRTSRTSRP